ncbi:MAG: hypothetical protein HRT89_06285 [Lentisphaeria bacterium]|nr:hypothetical protein [Lentisphaeria bacterium]
MVTRIHQHDISVMHMRSKFTVKNPATVKGCTLSLDYWGGVIVRVNGKEVARGHMKGELPVDYPEEAFLNGKGKPLDNRKKKDAERLALRKRTSTIKIPSKLLRAGMNVVTVELRQAPVLQKANVKPAAVYNSHKVRRFWNLEWPPIGLLRARMTTSSGAVVGDKARSKGIKVWNNPPHNTAFVFDYGNPVEKTSPVLIHAARNTVFSGRLMVGSAQAIKGLKVKVGDLTSKGGGKLPGSIVQIRYAAPVSAAKSWVPLDRFDGLMERIPAVVPVYKTPLKRKKFYGALVDRSDFTPRAVAPIWLSVRVPANAAPGIYEGTISLTAAGLKPTTIPLRVSVSAWTMEAPAKRRVQNYLCYAEEVYPRYYGVPVWSDKHFDMVGKTLALAAEANSRQVYANLTVNFMGNNTNPDALVRWVKQSGGKFKYDFTIFDKYMDMVAKTIGKPSNLRLHCWPSAGKYQTGGGTLVAVLEPGGKISTMAQPTVGTPENLAFWQPVISKVLKKLKARGWLDITTFGYNIYNSVPPPKMVDVAYKLWPEGAWSISSHCGAQDMKFLGTNPKVVMPVRYASAIRSTGPKPGRPPMPRQNAFCKATRAGGGTESFFNDKSAVGDLLSVVEEVVNVGYDGLCEFGLNLFPLKKKTGGYYIPQVGRGINWAGSGRSTAAILAPGPDGPLGTERFEMFREGTQLCEAMLFVKAQLGNAKVGAALKKKAGDVLKRRKQALSRTWFGFRHMPETYNAELLEVAGEMAQAAGK